MNNDEIERRIALKKLFQERMNTISEEVETPYVSRLVKSEVKVPEKKAPIKVTKKDLDKIKKECFKPIVKIDETNLEYEGSKYFGKVWLSNEEKWPTNTKGEYLIFVLQLEISSLPEKYKNDLGGEGLVQFFFDVDWPADDVLIRIVFPNEHGAYHEQPLNSDAFNYLIEGKKPKQKVIKSWKSDKDLPNGEEEFSEELQSTVEALMENDKDDKICAIQGDKLGGYAFWTQAGSSSENLLYQIDAGCFYYNKMGQENIFMKAIENDAVGSIKWHGEDGKEWTTQFFGSNVIDDQPVPKKIGMKK